MEKSHSHDGYKATRKRKKVKRPFLWFIEEARISPVVGRKGP
jgi:hypothetical protein